MLHWTAAFPEQLQGRRIWFVSWFWRDFLVVWGNSVVRTLFCHFLNIVVCIIELVLRLTIS